MPTSKPKAGRPRLWLLLLAVSATSLTGCAPTRSTEACPAPVMPSRCAVDFYEQTQTPACFDDWIDKLERQQCVLAGKKDCGK